MLYVHTEGGSDMRDYEIRGENQNTDWRKKEEKKRTMLSKGNNSTASDSTQTQVGKKRK